MLNEGLKNSEICLRQLMNQTVDLIYTLKQPILLCNKEGDSVSS